MEKVDTWQLPYNGKRTTKYYTRCQTGVYFIRDKNSKNIIYIGMSRSCLYKALYRHFETWNDYRFPRVVYHTRQNYEVRVLLLPLNWISYAEVRLIKYFLPRDNNEFYKDIQDPATLRLNNKTKLEDLPY